MKKILCYGDSNTFGLVAETLLRYDENERWSGVLKNLLKNKYEVIEEGLSDRNACVKNVKGYEYCSLEHLPQYLNQNQNIDIVVLAVGTNDLQFVYNFNSDILTEGLRKLINIVKKYNTKTEIIIIPPVKLDEFVKTGFFGYQFDDTSVRKSDETFELYEKIAKETNSGYFDFNKVARPSNKDGLHYEVNTHKLIAEKLAKYITDNY